MKWHDAAALSTMWLVLAGTAAVYAQAIQPTPRTDRVGETWTPSKTSFGHPDLQGVWAHDSLALFERPTELAPNALPTDAEMAQVRAADGRTRPRTPETQARAGMLGRSTSTPPSGPEDRSLMERCITSGVPWVLTGYNSVYRILQTPDHVVLQMEHIHDARIVPVDGRPHVSRRISQWLGDSRGRWEGNTLVIETTNFRPKGTIVLIGGAADGLTVTERFTRTDAETLKYEWTVRDPQTLGRSRTGIAPLKKIAANVYEYACHEENHGMVGVLAGARMQERANAAASEK